MFGLCLRVLITLSVIGIASALPVLAQDTSMGALLTEIDMRLQNKVTKQNAIQAGRERAVLCKSCHGEDGNSTKPDVPNLAGQNAGYLLDQINRFADGRRKDFVMNQLAENFTIEDKINIAIFYYSMPVIKPKHVNWHLAYKGETLYKAICSVCHGEEGLGHINLARLAGQQTTYVKKVLTGFRNSALHPASASSERKSPTMEKIAKNLTNEEIAQLAEFIAQLPSDDFE